MPVLTWQDYLLIGVSVTVAFFVVVFAARVMLHAIRSDRARLKLLNDVVAEVREFMAQLAKEVGTDSGKSLATRLHSQDDALEVARKLADERAADATKSQRDALDARTELRQMIATVSDALERLGREVAQNQKFTEHDAAQAARINDLSRDLHAAQIINQIHSPTTTERHGGVDIGGDGKIKAGKDVVAGGKSIGGDEIGGDKTLEGTKIKGVIEGVITDTK